MLPKPLLDDNVPWKQRFRAERRFASLAPYNPNRGLVASNRSGMFQLYAWDVPTGELRQLTERPAGTIFGQIAPNGEWVYYLDDTRGNELGHYVRVPWGGGEPQDLTPDLPPHPMSSAGVSGSGNLFGLTVPGPDGFDFYVLAQGTDGSVGEPHLLYRSKTLSHGPVFSREGEVAVWAVARQRKLAMGQLALAPDSGEILAELWEGEDGSVEARSFSPCPGDTRLLATTDRSGSTRPLIWDARSGERVDLPVDCLEGEVDPWGWTHDARKIVLCQIVRASQQLWLYDLDRGELRRLAHPTGTLSLAGFLLHGDVAVQWGDATHPGQVMVLDGETGEQKDVLLPAVSVPTGRPWQSITFPSSDGEEIQAWVATPEGDGPFPTILETHGGPTFAQFNVFSPASQCWLDHGFAFCSVNYRGSTTFGRDFERKIWGDLGHWEVEDMVAARAWLIQEGIAHRAAILVSGWSYGGYLTLHALGTKPDLWAGGMGGVVVADWVSQYEDENETLRGYDMALFGAPLQEMREQYVKSSPLTYVEQLAAPVLIIQGRNDTRDPPRQVELYEAKAREYGKAVEVEWFDTGHAGSTMDCELAIKHQELMLTFAYRVLQSRQSRV